MPNHNPPNEPLSLYRPGVGAMIMNKDNRIWVGLRIDRHQIKISSVTQDEPWQMPQGGIDEGEDPYGALVRELEEEIGLTPAHYKIKAETPDWLFYDLPPELQGKLWGGKYRGQRQKWFLLDLIGEDSDINLHTYHPEFEAWRWVKPSEVCDLIVPFKKEIYEKVLQCFAPFL